MEGTERSESDKGTPQGGLISPTLANAYLHYVLDLWVERVLKAQLKGDVRYVRYADDFLFMIQYGSEAETVMGKLKSRLSKFGLEVAQDKTRILPIGRFRGTKESFDFLGFTFFNAKTRLGRYRVGVRTSKKKLKAKKQAAKAWLKGRRTKPVAETMKLIGVSLKGHCNYYGVNGNYSMIKNFCNYVKLECYRILNKRDQKGTFPVAKFNRTWSHYIDPPQITVSIWHKPMLI